MYIITKKRKIGLEPNTYLHKDKVSWVDKKSKDIGVFDYEQANEITSNLESEYYWFLKTFLAT